MKIINNIFYIFVFFLNIMILFPFFNNLKLLTFRIRFLKYNNHICQNKNVQKYLILINNFKLIDILLLKL